jgi:hypothetical protein
MVTRQLAIQTVLVCTASGLIFSACSNSSGTSPGVLQMQQTTQWVSPHKRMAAQERASAHSNPNANCILIDSVYPKSDFHGLGFTAAAVSGGDHLNIDATGCTYGIYLYPGAPDLNIDHAIVKNAYRVQIFAEDVSGVTINNTLARASSPSLAGIAFRGAGGTVDHTAIFNTSVTGMNIVANDGCFEPALTPCMQSNVRVDYTLIDNSKSTGDGFDVIGGPLPQRSVGSISHSIVKGPNTAALPGSEVDLYGAQVAYAYFDATLTADFDSAINNQIGFDVYCSHGISSTADLAKDHDIVTFATKVTLPTTPLPENQVLNKFSASQLDAIFGPGAC